MYKINLGNFNNIELLFNLGFYELKFNRYDGKQFIYVMNRSLFKMLLQLNFGEYANIYSINSIYYINFSNFDDKLYNLRLHRTSDYYEIMIYSFSKVEFFVFIEMLKFFKEKTK